MKMKVGDASINMFMEKIVILFFMIAVESLFLGFVFDESKLFLHKSFDTSE